METRPYIICHMMASLDGRIDCDMTEQIDDTNHYYEALDQLECPSVMEGKITLVKHSALPGFFQGTHPYKEAGRQVYKAVEAEGYAIGVDTSGSLLWGDDTTEHFGKPLLMILSENASEEYLAYLNSKQISYLTIGQDSIDLKAAMEILRSEFGVERLAVVGGGHINGSMLDLGLIDEVSMMYGYGIDGREGMAAAFDGRPKSRGPVRLTFKSVTEQDGIVWMRYLVGRP
ncbi:MAG: dihydrofolate reductase family protein [Muribaculaceae bacterium]|nr:dihydrofolate reductase family protein [Muribaculaceae bacterium]